MNNFALLAANRLTHLKVVMLAFSCVTLVVGFGLVHSVPQREFGLALMFTSMIPIYWRAGRKRP